MKILSDLIAHLQGKDHPVKEVLAGAYWTAVVSRGCGLASTFRDEGHPHPRGVKEVGHLTEKSALDLAAYALSDYPMEASIGLAAINSLMEIDPGLGRKGVEGLEAGYGFLNPGGVEAQGPPPLVGRDF